MIVGLCGYARSGKNTLADLITRHHGHQQIAFADALRDTLYDTNPLVSTDGARVQDVIDKHGFEGVKSTKYGPEVRRLLQMLGTDGVRNNVSDSAWVDVVLNKISAGGDWVVTDARFGNELDAIASAEGVLIWISRPGVEPANAHASENSVSESDCDFTIYNHGTPSDMLSQFKRYMDV